MTCYKKGFHANVVDEAVARLEKLNGHQMRAYRCPKCGDWHVTAQDIHGRSYKVLPWQRPQLGLFTAQVPSGCYIVKQGRNGWTATAPGGERSPLFNHWTPAKLWCEALEKKNQ